MLSCFRYEALFLSFPRPLVLKLSAHRTMILDLLPSRLRVINYPAFIRLIVKFSSNFSPRMSPWNTTVFLTIWESGRPVTHLWGRYFQASRLLLVFCPCMEASAIFLSQEGLWNLHLNEHKHLQAQKNLTNESKSSKRWLCVYFYILQSYKFLYRPDDNLTTSKPASPTVSHAVIDLTSETEDEVPTPSPRYEAVMSHNMTVLH